MRGLKRLPPYLIAGMVGTLLLLLLFFVQRARATALPAELIIAGYATATVVSLAAIAELFGLIRDYRAGHWFPLRSTSFLTAIIAWIGLPAYLIFTVVADSLEESTVWIAAAMLFVSVTGLSALRLSEVELQLKLGFKPRFSSPLFSVESIESDEHSILVSTAEGENLRLLRTMFFSSHWQRISQRLASLGPA